MLGPMLARHASSPRSLARPRTWLVLGLAALSWGCGSWEAETRAREQAMSVLDCRDVTLVQLSELRFRAEGCGAVVEVLCSSGHNEPVCLVGRARDDERVAGLSDLGAGGEDPQPGEDDGVSDDEAAGVERQIRGGLDARRDDVLACTGRSASIVRVRYEVSGAVTFSLGGDLEGSPEEGCVRAAMGAVRVEGGHEGTVLHLVRAAGRSSEAHASDDEPPSAGGFSDGDDTN